MKAVSHTGTSALQLLLNRAEEQVAQAVASNKHRAADIAAAIAANGNPSGA